MPEILSSPLTLILAGVLGYLLGSVPFGVVITRALGLGDLRQIGSGNIGATNVLRTGNKKLAALTLVGDMLKGTIAVLLAGCATAPVNHVAPDAPYAVPLERMSKTRPVIGLVLGAGGSRGFAHVGVLKALEAAGKKTDEAFIRAHHAAVMALYAEVAAASAALAESMKKKGE